MNRIALEEAQRHLFDEAFTRGFKASAEGWNGEYPENIIYTKEFQKLRDESVNAMLKEVFRG
ncbi:hypothetical protein [Roseibium sp. RKSG952]|uniref:hypothetical protein n=1 Tax=Roseibium sp. RKSG952 TaxID=2529384 RepID=UPI0012BD6282|nr:hypothetical protein [Roseibium sp. RKSG952]MTH95532.1 hypothetical protein [Roseibium sp. RKSG952]